jgi:hypothetical protein
MHESKFRVKKGNRPSQKSVFLVVEDSFLFQEKTENKENESKTGMELRSCHVYLVGKDQNQ